MGNVVAAVPVMNQPQRVQMAGAAFNAVEQHGALPKAVPTSHLPGGGGVGGQVVETMVVTSVTVVVVGLGVVTVVVVTVTSVLVVVVTVTSVVVAVVVVVVVGVSGQVVKVVVHSFRMARSPGERRLTHVRLNNSL